jgi:hypothetical protein
MPIFKVFSIALNLPKIAFLFINPKSKKHALDLRMYGNITMPVNSLINKWLASQASRRQADLKEKLICIRLHSFRRSLAFTDRRIAGKSGFEES